MLLKSALEETPSTSVGVDAVVGEGAASEIQASVYDRHPITLYQLVKPIGLDSIDKNAEGSRPTSDDQDVHLSRA